jgi:hypothetical protein
MTLARLTHTRSRQIDFVLMLQEQATDDSLERLTACVTPHFSTKTPTADNSKYLAKSINKVRRLRSPPTMMMMWFFTARRHPTWNFLRQCPLQQSLLVDSEH